MLTEYSSLYQFQFTPFREGRRPMYKVACVILIFQFTPLREGRPHVRRVKPGGHPYFNSRPSARGDGIVPCWNRRGTNFNSRPSARGDVVFCYVGDCFPISIPAPPRGATLCGMSSVRAVMHFNSRPSARGDVIFQPYELVCAISIPAPPRGATRV